MFYMISGGSGSGKSEFAEAIIEKLQKESQKTSLIYIATMKALDREAEEKINRHRKMRQNKGFITKECFGDLKNLLLPANSIVLLDCMSNLVANEMFQEERVKELVFQEILSGIEKLREQSKHLVVVTNEIFSDGIEYDEITQKYIENLGIINQRMAVQADVVAEVVCGIPIYHKTAWTIEADNR